MSIFSAIGHHHAVLLPGSEHIQGQCVSSARCGSRYRRFQAIELPIRNTNRTRFRNTGGGGVGLKDLPVAVLIAPASANMTLSIVGSRPHILGEEAIVAQREAAWMAGGSGRNFIIGVKQRSDRQSRCIGGPALLTRH